MALDRTNAVEVRSSVASARDPAGDFPIQNLPLGMFRAAKSDEPFRTGVAIGDQVLDLRRVASAHVLEAAAAAAAAAACHSSILNPLIAAGPSAWRSLREGLFDLLRDEAPPEQRRVASDSLIPQTAVDLALAVETRDYTDFYTSADHALNATKAFNVANSALPPSFTRMPLAYHGRASSLVVSGAPVPRPRAQVISAPDPRASPRPSAWLDYEVELGAFIGVANTRREPVGVADAWSRIFGLCLLNDWSARDIQALEMIPLGPFLSKSFATTLSPWILSTQALEPFRTAPSAREAIPDHLRGSAEGDALDIQLEAWLQTASREAAALPAVRLSRTSFKHQYWTFPQMLAHHTTAGCGLACGDLLGSGAVSGPTAPEAGSLLELARAGREPLRIGSKGEPVEERGFLADGDTVTLRGWCERPGFARIGFGSCRGTVVSAREGAA